MKTLADDLLAVACEVTQRIDIPAISSFDLAPEHPAGAPARRNNFAALSLADGSVGLTYVALDGALANLRNNPITGTLTGRNPIDIATLYTGDEGWQRALGLAAINAISQHVLARQKVFSPMQDTLTALEPTTQDHIGMVGYFGRLVDPLTAMGIRLTVIELDDTLVRSDHSVDVTLDTSKLSACNKIIVTGTTLLNHTVDHILKYCSNANQVLMLGPTASCLPDPLFERGITTIGGFHVTSHADFLQRWHSASSWRDSGSRYALHQAGYPGFSQLL